MHSISGQTNLISMLSIYDEINATSRRRTKRSTDLMLPCLAMARLSMLGRPGAGSAVIRKKNDQDQECSWTRPSTTAMSAGKGWPV